MIDTPQLLRGILGGVLMGLANLVPGISGGTMLLAAGVYPQFIGGIAEVTTLRFRAKTLSLLAAVGGASVIAIVALAGVVKGLVIDHRWVMFSLFIGLTLGGVPVVWRLLRPATAAAAVGCVGGIAVMATMAFLQPGGAETGIGERAYVMLFLAGVGGASAMILPGISGGYILLILGQYLTILGAVDDMKTALTTGGGPEWDRLTEALHVFVPVGVGIAVGVVVISNLVKILLERFRKPTLGVLLGLLLGAVLGLWPFRQGVAPQPGDVIRGRVMTAQTIEALDAKDFPLERFMPTGRQWAGAAGLIVGGFLLTQAVALVGGAGERSEAAPDRPA